MSPLFSVVVPCYRVAHRRHLVEECLGSIAAQTLADYELLLVDDGSGDGSAAMLRGLAAGDATLAPRARVVALPSNEGVCAARNAGIALARGRWIALLDFDDLWHPEYLARVGDAIESWPHTRVFLVQTDFWRTFGGEQRVQAGTSLAELNSLDAIDFCGWHLLHNFPVAMGSALVIERSLLAEHDELRFDLALSRSTAEDVLFGFQLLALGLRPRYIAEPLCVHRRFLEAESRGTAAFLRVDEWAVNDYIAEKATRALERRVLEQRPALAPQLAQQRGRLEREFGLKRELRNPWQGFGLGRCVRDPRALRPWLRLVALQLLWGGPCDGWLRRRFFTMGGDDAQARRRVAGLLEALQRRDAIAG